MYQNVVSVICRKYFKDLFTFMLTLLSQSFLFYPTDWTQSLTKYLKEQLQKIQDHYHGGISGPQTSFLLTSQPTTQVDMEHALKQWTYCTRLAKHMYNVSLW